MTDLDTDIATGTTPRHDEAEHRRAANRAVGVSAVGLGVTGLVELALAIVTGSVALLGDALHNLSDVSTSAVVFAGFRISKRPPTRRYPYGYERAQDLAGLGVALVIWASAVFAGVESFRKLVGHGHTRNVYFGMAGAVLGIIGNQLVARYKLRIGRRINSTTLVADAKHSWLDALSSAGALAGLVLVAAGYRWGDPIAGFAVTLFILHVGWDTIRFYERVGLLRANSRTATNHRRYDYSAVDRMRFIQGAQRLGLRLADVRGLLDVRDTGECPCEPAASLLRQRLADIDDEITKLTRLRDDLAQFLERIPAADCSDPAPGTWRPREQVSV